MAKGFETGFIEEHKNFHINEVIGQRCQAALISFFPIFGSERLNS